VFHQVGSLESPLNDKTDLFLKDLIREEESQSPEKIVDVIKSHEELEFLLKKLNRQEQKILKMRFGIVDGKTSNLREIGKAIQLSRERVRQIEKKALHKLKNLILKRELLVK
jgi:RNA polymerase primary sigma factor